MRIRHKKITLSVPEDLLAELDRASKEAGVTRSGVASTWLAAGRAAAAQERYRKELEEYYANPDPEDAAIARASSRAARGLVIDESGPTYSATRRKK